MGTVQAPWKVPAQAFICFYVWYITAFTSEPLQVLPHWKDVIVSPNDY